MRSGQLYIWGQPCQWYWAIHRQRLHVAFVDSLSCSLTLVKNSHQALVHDDTYAWWSINYICVFELTNFGTDWNGRRVADITTRAVSRAMFTLSKIDTSKHKVPQPSRLVVAIQLGPTSDHSWTLLRAGLIKVHCCFELVYGGPWSCCQLVRPIHMLPDASHLGS